MGLARGVGSLAVDAVFGRSTGIPFMPVWPGFLVNAMVHSPIIFGLHQAWRWWVRHYRRSNGLCTGCGYERKGLAEAAACPECGAALPATAPSQP